MRILSFDVNKLFSYRWCGKFQSPTPEWMHLTRQLRDFELMVVTEGTLYIASNEDKYTVKKGEYLLMKPSPLQYGHKLQIVLFTGFTLLITRMQMIPYNFITMMIILSWIQTF